MPVADGWPCGRNATVGVRYRHVNAALRTGGARDRNAPDEEQRKSPQRGVPRETACSCRHVELAKR